MNPYLALLRQNRNFRLSTSARRSRSSATGSNTVAIFALVLDSTGSATSFFEPARTSTIPNVTSDRELMPANALSSATWSAMLALGASIGHFGGAILP